MAGKEFLTVSLVQQYNPGLSDRSCQRISGERHEYIHHEHVYVYVCVRLWYWLSAHRTVQDGASHAALPTIDVQGGERTVTHEVALIINSGKLTRPTLSLVWDPSRHLCAGRRTPSEWRGLQPCADLSRLSTPTWGNDRLTQFSSFAFQLMEIWNRSAMTGRHTEKQCSGKRKKQTYLR